MRCPIPLGIRDIGRANVRVAIGILLVVLGIFGLAAEIWAFKRNPRRAVAETVTETVGALLTRFGVPGVVLWLLSLVFGVGILWSHFGD